MEDWIKGSLLMLAAIITWSLRLIMQGSIVKQDPVKLHFTTIQCFFSCILSALWAVAVDRDLSSWKLGWDINLLSMFYCGVIVTDYLLVESLGCREERRCIHCNVQSIGEVFVVLYCWWETSIAFCGGRTKKKNGKKKKMKNQKPKRKQ